MYKTHDEFRTVSISSSLQMPKLGVFVLVGQAAVMFLNVVAWATVTECVGRGSDGLTKCN